MVLPRLSPQEASARHEVNVANVQALKDKVSPLVTAAAGMAQTARELKDYATELQQSGQRTLTSSYGYSVSTKDTVKSLNVAKNALKSVASKAQSLEREIAFFSNHQEGLFRGNLRMVPQGDKVNWCTGQVEKLQKRTSKLGNSEAATVGSSVQSIQAAGAVLKRSVTNTDLPSRLAALR